jgi:ATP-binding protein involved in chromosome partitioning
MPAHHRSRADRALKTVIDPHTGRDFVSGKQLKNLRIDGDDVSFDIELGYPAQEPARRRCARP